MINTKTTRKFNTTGVCIPSKHYMVDISDKLAQITALIDDGRYFTINRGRQYGKTTTFSRLDAMLRDVYYVIRISFEGVGDSGFSDNRKFTIMFADLVARELERCRIDDNIVNEWTAVKILADPDVDPFKELGDGISRLCRAADRSVLLLIDEIDKCTDNQVFLNFLGLLRNKYLDAQDERDYTFYSVVLAGVYDVRNLKLKLRPDEERKYNSPWNIAVDFDIEMSFSAAEIGTMLSDYESDNNLGMDIKGVSEKLHFYTGGYPFLVSWLCRWMDEKAGKIFTVENVTTAVGEMLKTTNMLFDDMFKNVYEYSDFADIIRNMLIEGKEYMYTRSIPTIDLGVTFGIFSSDGGKLAISNIIFETLLYNHFLTEKSIESNNFSFEKSQFVNEDKSLNMPRILEKFRELMYAEYRSDDEKFYEKQGRLLFLCFLKPIINGTGNYYVEPQTRQNGRMDIVVFYENKEYIIELKIWHGEAYRQKGLLQLAGYMDARNAENGYLISFQAEKDITADGQDTLQSISLVNKLEIESASGKKHDIYEITI